MPTTPTDLADTLAAMRRDIGDLKRRMRGRSREGVVAEVNEAEGLYRVRFAEGDRPFVGPWMRVQALSTGGVKIQAEPVVGQAVTVTSESGDLADGVIALSSFSSDEPRPGSAGGELVIAAGSVLFKVTSAGVEITGPLTINGASVTHNGTNIGDDHVHSGVDPGPASTGGPS